MREQTLDESLGTLRIDEPAEQKADTPGAHTEEDIVHAIHDVVEEADPVDAVEMFAKIAPRVFRDIDKHSSRGVKSFFILLDIVEDIREQLSEFRSIRSQDPGSATPIAEQIKHDIDEMYVTFAEAHRGLIRAEQASQSRDAPPPVKRTTVDSRHWKAAEAQKTATNRAQRETLSLMYDISGKSKATQAYREARSRRAPPAEQRHYERLKTIDDLRIAKSLNDDGRLDQMIDGLEKRIEGYQRYAGLPSREHGGVSTQIGKQGRILRGGIGMAMPETVVTRGGGSSRRPSFAPTPAFMQAPIPGGEPDAEAEQAAVSKLEDVKRRWEAGTGDVTSYHLMRAAVTDDHPHLDEEVAKRYGRIVHNIAKDRNSWFTTSDAGRLILEIVTEMADETRGEEEEKENTVVAFDKLYKKMRLLSMDSDAYQQFSRAWKFRNQLLTQFKRAHDAYTKAMAELPTGSDEKEPDPDTERKEAAITATFKAARANKNAQLEELAKNPAIIIVDEARDALKTFLKHLRVPEKFAAYARKQATPFYARANDRDLRAGGIGLVPQGYDVKGFPRQSVYDTALYNSKPEDRKIKPNSSSAVFSNIKNVIDREVSGKFGFTYEHKDTGYKGRKNIEQLDPSVLQQFGVASYEELLNQNKRSLNILDTAKNIYELLEPVGKSDEVQHLYTALGGWRPYAPGGKGGRAKIKSRGYEQSRKDVVEIIQRISSLLPKKNILRYAVYHIIEHPTAYRIQKRYPLGWPGATQLPLFTTAVQGSGSKTDVDLISEVLGLAPGSTDREDSIKKLVKRRQKIYGSDEKTAKDVITKWLKIITSAAGRAVKGYRKGAVNPVAFFNTWVTSKLLKRGPQLELPAPRKYKSPFRGRFRPVIETRLARPVGVINQGAEVNNQILVPVRLVEWNDPKNLQQLSGKKKPTPHGSAKQLYSNYPTILPQVLKDSRLLEGLVTADGTNFLQLEKRLLTGYIAIDHGSAHLMGKRNEDELSPASRALHHKLSKIQRHREGEFPISHNIALGIIKNAKDRHKGFQNRRDHEKSQKNYERAHRTAGLLQVLHGYNTQVSGKTGQTALSRKWGEANDVFLPMFEGKDQTHALVGRFVKHRRSGPQDAWDGMFTNFYLPNFQKFNALAEHLVRNVDGERLEEVKAKWPGSPTTYNILQKYLNGNQRSISSMAVFSKIMQKNIIQYLARAQRDDAPPPERVRVAESEGSLLNAARRYFNLRAVIPEPPSRSLTRSPPPRRRKRDRSPTPDVSEYSTDRELFDHIIHGAARPRSRQRTEEREPEAVKDEFAAPAPIRRSLSRPEIINLIEDEEADPYIDLPALEEEEQPGFLPVGEDGVILPFSLQSDVPIDASRHVRQHFVRSQPNNRVYGQVSLVRPATGVEEDHFMYGLEREMAKDQVLMVNEARRGPFRDQTGRSRIVHSTANTVYRRRGSNIEITVTRKATLPEIAILIAKINAHSFMNNSSFLTLLMRGNTHRMGPVTGVNLDLLRKQIIQGIKKHGSVGILITDVRSGPLSEFQIHNYDFASDVMQNKSLFAV